MAADYQKSHSHKNIYHQFINTVAEILTYA